jgi:hypothetical protein
MMIAPFAGSVSGKGDAPSGIKQEPWEKRTGSDGYDGYSEQGRRMISCGLAY